MARCLYIVTLTLVTIYKPNNQLVPQVRSNALMSPIKPRAASTDVDNTDTDKDNDNASFSGSRRRSSVMSDKMKIAEKNKSTGRQLVYEGSITNVLNQVSHYSLCKFYFLCELECS